MFIQTGAHIGNNLIQIFNNSVRIYKYIALLVMIYVIKSYKKYIGLYIHMRC